MQFSQHKEAINCLNMSTIVIIVIIIAVDTVSCHVTLLFLSFHLSPISWIGLNGKMPSQPCNSRNFNVIF